MSFLLNTYCNKAVRETGEFLHTPFNLRSKTIEVAKKFGTHVSLNSVRDASINDFHLASNLKPYFLTYQILHWSTKFTLAKITEGVLNKNGKDFIVIYHKCTRYDAKNSPDLVLSFREPSKEFGIPAYVLIKTTLLACPI